MKIILKLCVFLITCALCIIMLYTISQYASSNLQIGFLLLKQNYIQNKLWLTCFYIHVFTAIISLFAGLSQFSHYFLIHYKKWHKRIGKIYIANIIVINVPTGMVLAIFANGGLIGKIAFIFLDVLWLIFTYAAYYYIKRKNIIKHKEMMIRSYALTFSAITLRLWKLFFINCTNLDEATIYQIDAVLGFMLNLIVAEIYIWYLSRKSKIV